MTVSAPTFDAHVALESKNRLGEGILWDDRTGRLHWVDIDRAEIHSYDPKSGGYAVDQYPETEYVTALAPRDGPGFVAALGEKIVFLTPSEPTVPPTRNQSKSSETLAEPIAPSLLKSRMVRFNDGACDPSGRFIVGSMTLPECRDGQDRGQLFSVSRDGTQTLFGGVGTSNGIDFSPDGRTMYYIDSNIGRVDQFDYDVDTGSLSNRRPLTTAADLGATTGAFDGLIVDGSGNIWIARWGDSRVVVYSPAGQLLLQVNTPGAISPTIPCFGGDNLETLYIATAHADLAGQGEIQDKYPHSGDVFALDCSVGTPVREILGNNWKGRVRYRFAG